MWSLRFSVIAVLVVALSCGGAPPPSGVLSSAWVAPAILAHVPADSPYLVASLEPLSEKTRQRMLHGLDQRVAELLRLADDARGADPSTLQPWMRAGLALADELRGKPATNWWRELGFAPSGRFALYGLSAWPVLRIDVADPVRLRGAIAHVLSAAGTRPRQATLDGHAYWSAGIAELTLVAAVLDHEAVVAIVPTPALPTALPLVLGTQKPARSLRTTTTIPELFGRHHLMGIMLAYLDARNAVDLVTTPRPGELEAPLRALTGPISPACRADLERLVAIAPRAVFGYRRLDDAGFEGVGILETAPSVTSALAKLRAIVPGVMSPSAGHPLVAMGVAIDPDELLSWLRGIVSQLHEHPFACPWLSGINEAGARLAEQLATPVPPMWRGVRGFSLVVDDATILPPSVEGHLLVASDRIADLVSTLSGTVPAIAGLAVRPDGRPVAIPAQQLGLPLPSVHLAMLPDRLVVASGPDSAQRTADRVATPSPRSSPLFVMAFDAPRLQRLLASVGQGSADTLGYLGNIGMSIDVAKEGIGFDVWGTWSETSPLGSPAQPLTQP
jgi:hypothetical protein